MANELQHLPHTLSDMQQMAVAVAKSQLFGPKTPEQAMALMLLAQAEGLHPMIAARDYDIVQGRPAKKAEAMLRSFLLGGGRVEWHVSDRTQAEATFSHPQGGTIKVRWDMTRAQQMGLGSKDNWKKMPDVMLRWRCVSEGVRIIWPMATSGMYVPEEVSDFEPRKTPPRREAPALRQEPPQEVVAADGEVIDTTPVETLHGSAEPAFDRSPLELARTAAGMGKEAFLMFWKGCDADARREIKGHMSELEQAALDADARKSAPVTAEA